MPVVYKAQRGGHRGGCSVEQGRHLAREPLRIQLSADPAEVAVRREPAQSEDNWQEDQELSDIEEHGQ